MSKGPIYILSGHLTVYSYDVETDEQTDERSVGPNDAILIPSMEPHSMKNASETEGAIFLCCIASVYEDE